MPYDGDALDIVTTAIAMPELVARLQASSAQQVVAFLDACYSGTGGRSVASKNRSIVREKTLGAEKTAVFSAAHIDQVAGPTARGDRGLFTSTLIAALRGLAADIDGDPNLTGAACSGQSVPLVAEPTAPRIALREANVLLRPVAGGEELLRREVTPSGSGGLSIAAELALGCRVAITRKTTAVREQNWVHVKSYAMLDADYMKLIKLGLGASDIEKVALDVEQSEVLTATVAGPCGTPEHLAASRWSRYTFHYVVEPAPAGALSRGEP